MDDQQINQSSSGAPQAPQDELEKVKKERDEYLDGWKRAKADYANYKKEELRRVETFLKLSNEQLVRDLIVVLDSFDLALQSLQGEAKAEKGMYLIQSQLADVLKKYGLEQIEVKVGENFDPSVHDAIASVESQLPSGSIVEEVEKGYRLGDKMIRAVRVKVSR